MIAGTKGNEIDGKIRLDKILFSDSQIVGCSSSVLCVCALALIGDGKDGEVKHLWIHDGCTCKEENHVHK